MLGFVAYLDHHRMNFQLPNSLPDATANPVPKRGDLKTISTVQMSFAKPALKPNSSAREYLSSWEVMWQRAIEKE